MGVVGSAAELTDSPQGSVSIGKDAKSSFTRKFRVETSSTADGPITVMYASGIPADYSVYGFGGESHALCRLKNKSAQRMGPASLFWEVTCKYETLDEEEDDPDDPLQEKPILSFDWETTQELVKGTYESAADPTDGVRNSAGELFKQQPTREVDNIVITITRNEHIATDIGSIANTHNNTINSGAWGGFAAHSLRLRIKASREYKEIGENPKQQVAYLKVTYSIKHRKETWDLKLLDHGSYHIKDGNKINFETETGDRYLGLLDKTGKETATPTFLDPMQVYPTSDFSSLNLPTSFLEAL